MNVTISDSGVIDDAPPASFLNTEPQTFPPTDDAPFRCEVCGTSLIYAGRGRRPRFCAEHKTKGAAASARTGTSMRGLENSLADLYRGLGFGLNFVDPLAGMEVANSADALAHSWIVLAESNPKVRKWLMKITTGSGVGGVVIAHAMVAIPIMKRHDVLPGFKVKDD